MEHRITYVLPSSSYTALNPASLHVTPTSLTIPALPAAKEHRVTFDVDTLPDELIEILAKSRSLHIRWTRARSYEAVAPFSARTPVGLGVLWAPDVGEEGEWGEIAEKLCQQLDSGFNDATSCDADAFTLASASAPTPSTHLRQETQDRTLQYHAFDISVAHMENTVQIMLCRGVIPSRQAHDAPCHDTLEPFNSATYIDIDYTTSSFSSRSRKLAVTAFWDRSLNEGEGWDERVEKKDGDDRVEVGILHEAARKDGDEAHEIGFEGFLTVLGQDDGAKATRFTAPSRHHTLPPSQGSTYHSTIDTPVGLHPTLRLHFPSPPSPPPSQSQTASQDQGICTLTAYLTLPSSLFIDRHPLSDPLTLKSHNLTSLLSLSGATDLEAPVWNVRGWGSSALFSLSLPPPLSNAPASQRSKSEKSRKEEERRMTGHTATIPLHLRYLPPSPGGYTNTTFPDPVVFWACAPSSAPSSSSTSSSSSEEEQTEAETELAMNPFDRRKLGYDALFPGSTVFYHLTPRSTLRMSEIYSLDTGEVDQEMLIKSMRVPVLDTTALGAQWIDSVTALVVVGGFVWVCWCLFGPLPSRETPVIGSGDGDGEGRDKKVEKDEDIKGEDRKSR